MEAFKNIVWFTGISYPGPLLAYERSLAAYLDNGGHLMVSGQDILDQGAGTTPFVHNYLHIDWDGTDRQNDLATAAVHGVTANPVTSGIGVMTACTCRRESCSNRMSRLVTMPTSTPSASITGTPEIR